MEKTLDEKPATWERYEHEEGGKEKILDMEIREYKQAKERREEGKLGKKEAYKAAKHVAAAFDPKRGESWFPPPPFS